MTKTSAEYARAVRAAVERLDVLEAPRPRRGCNARADDGARCGRRVVSRGGGYFSERRLCSEHVALYRAHDRVLARILSFSEGRA